MEELDRIERAIEIAAPAERVWDLVSVPGWYINDGEIVDHVIERVDEVDVVHDPVHGAFAFRTEKLDPPRYAAFRWFSGRPGDDLGRAGSTLVEFFIDERDTGGVSLRVVESGFATLPVAEEERRQRAAENTAGWTQELALARDLLEGRGEPG